MDGDEAAVRRHQRRFTVRAQGPMWPLATDVAGKDAFRLKPDVVLFDRKRVRFILDAKWKPLDLVAPNHGVSQDDAYQLFAYGKRYGCRRGIGGGRCRPVPGRLRGSSSRKAPSGTATFGD